jgi:hypothetical protein
MYRISCAGALLLWQAGVGSGAARKGSELMTRRRLDRGHQQSFSNRHELRHLRKEHLTEVHQVMTMQTAGCGRNFQAHTPISGRAEHVLQGRGIEHPQAPGLQRRGVGRLDLLPDRHRERSEAVFELATEQGHRLLLAAFLMTGLFAFLEDFTEEGILANIDHDRHVLRLLEHQRV